MPAGQRTVAAVAIAGKIINDGDDFGAQRIEMNIGDELFEVGVFLADDGFIAILKQLAVALLAMVELARVAAEQPPHQRGQPARTRAQQKMGVVVQKCPCVAGRPGLRQQISQPLDKVFAVVIVPKDLASLDAPDDHMMQNSRRIEPG